MRRPMVAGNWKMNGSREFSNALVHDVIEGAGALDDGVEVVLCPPFVYLERVGDLLSARRGVALGAQDVDCHEGGAHTGDVAGAMLRDVGCDYVIVGHSERRARHGESDAAVAGKAAAALSVGLTPIVCVGETLEQRESGAAEATVAAQLDALAGTLGNGALARAVIAYEPVWAIGTGRTATPDEAQEVHALLRARLARDAARTRILYGGSVKPDNARELFAQPDIDGGLIGGASLDADDFLAICKAAA